LFHGRDSVNGAGSKIHDNTIQAINRRLLGGINLMDPIERGFDYTGTEVYRNTIPSNGARIKLALGMGPRTAGFHCGGDELGRGDIEGGLVYQNHLEGDNFGFGYVLNGVRDWQFFDNTADGTFSGFPQGCNGNDGTGLPGQR